MNIVPSHKTCRVCKADLPLASFTKNPKKTDGLETVCSPCHRQQVRERYASAVEEWKTNPESSCLTQRVCAYCGSLFLHPKVRTKTFCSNECACRQRNTTHGLGKHPLYNLWNGMIGRCYRPKCPNYAMYGARGISVCDEWRDFPTFVQWAETNGYSPELQLDRRDNDGNYSPQNCRFVTATVNMRNRAVSKYLTAFGERKHIQDWAKDPRCVLGVEGMYGRIKSGWSEQDVVSAPRVHENYKRKQKVVG